MHSLPVFFQYLFWIIPAVFLVFAYGVMGLSSRYENRYVLLSIYLTVVLIGVVCIGWSFVVISIILKYMTIHYFLALFVYVGIIVFAAIAVVDSSKNIIR